MPLAVGWQVKPWSHEIETTLLAGQRTLSTQGYGSISKISVCAWGGEDIHADGSEGVIQSPLMGVKP